ncbi:HIT domain-containing protein [Rhodobacteraceae bacterium R_SAG10]|jgi:histidine triad (HIT) family protein|nr:HIT domain-containing protein [Rhodobacteraceae bacterium R_SAG10]
MAYVYDDQNIFAKILRGEIPSSTVLETEHCLAFQDISEQAPVHVLVIPRGPYLNFDHFAVEASEAEIVDFSRTIGKVCQMTAVSPDNGGGGYRLISNAGKDGVQEVGHLHVHILGGRMLGRMLSSSA